MTYQPCKLKRFVVFILTALAIFTTLGNLFAQDNPNTITFENQSGELALVRLIGKTQQVIEVPNGRSRTVNVSAGEYYILIRYGNEPSKYAYSRGNPFTVTQTAERYSAITITLHTVIDGNYLTHPISEKEFNVASEESVNKEYDKTQIIPPERFDIRELPPNVQSIRIIQPLISKPLFKGIEPSIIPEPLKFTPPNISEITKPLFSSEFLFDLSQLHLKVADTNIIDSIVINDPPDTIHFRPDGNEKMVIVNLKGRSPNKCNIPIMASMFTAMYQTKNSSDHSEYFLSPVGIKNSIAVSLNNRWTFNENMGIYNAIESDSLLLRLVFILPESWDEFQIGFPTIAKEKIIIAPRK
jgi:hypothetical protein